jgi:hypothetical protein
MSQKPRPLVLYVTPRSQRFAFSKVAGNQHPPVDDDLEIVRLSAARVMDEAGAAIAR